MNLFGVSVSANTVAIGLAVTLLALVVPHEARVSRSASSGSELAVTETRIRTDLVILTAWVYDDNGEPVTNLRHTDFTVFDRDAPQPIDFWSRLDEPMSVVIVFDTSSSVVKSGSTSLAAISQGILHFKQKSHEQNEYSLIGADLIPQLLTDWTRDSDALIEGLSKLTLITPKAQTAIYDACQLALQKLGERPAIKSAVLLISDGQDGESTLSYSDLQNSMRRSAGLVFLISPSDFTKRLAWTGRGNLARLSLESGATAFFPSDHQVDAAFGAIASELRTLYVIGYYPPNKIRDGAWHPVRITARRQTEGSTDNPELIVRTRSGYYSPTEPR